MANRESADAERSEKRRQRTEIGSVEKSAAQSGDIDGQRRPTLDELRSLRTDIYTGGTARSSAPAPRMLSAAVSKSSLTTSKSTSLKHKIKKSTSHRIDANRKPRKQRRAGSRDEDSPQIYVYGPTKEAKERSSGRTTTATRTLGTDDGSCDSEDDSDGLSFVSEKLERKRKVRKVRIVYVEEERPKSLRNSSRRGLALREKSTKDKVKASEKRSHRSNTTSSRRNSIIPPLDDLKRTLSARELKDPRPVLKRSHTTGSNQRTVKSRYEPSVTSTRKTVPTKPLTFLGGLFASPHKVLPPPKLVECMTCLSDDIPRSKSAKLKCGHRMCQTCLKRIFRLSVKDPQHMPPKCCTADLIPLKHVDSLFDVEFKKLWNKKFQEYSTNGRIYCPARRCGEWIKPGNIHTEGGKKYGKCGRCKTKVCCLCNGKWHGSKECPKDEETNALLEAAKKAGWQRCYSCRTMVELKEGCNHMTCRCTAEFCMLCGLKWKSCNCPWFNYDQVEEDRLNHLRVPGPDRLQHMRIPEPLARFHQRPPRPPVGYDEELDARRRQELLDEDLARRLQTLGVDDDDDYNGDIGDIHGVGNAGDHFMNQDYRHGALRPNPVNAHANYVLGINRARGIPIPPPPPPPPPALNAVPALRRRPSARAEQHNNSTMIRPSERVIPRRIRTDYASEAARHAPAVTSSTPRRTRPSRIVPVLNVAPRPSVLAGLAGAGRGSGRVGAWRVHVQPGVEAAEEVSAF